MKRIGLTLALLASVSMTTLPAVAAGGVSSQAPRHHAVPANYKLAHGSALLTQAQFDGLAKSRPSMHAKLAKALQNGTVPHLTQSEVRVIQALNAQTIKQMKAGQLIEIITAVTSLIIAIGYTFYIISGGKPENARSAPQATAWLCGLPVVNLVGQLLGGCKTGTILVNDR